MRILHDYCMYDMMDVVICCQFWQFFSLSTHISTGRNWYKLRIFWYFCPSLFLVLFAVADGLASSVLAKNNLVVEVVILLNCCKI